MSYYGNKYNKMRNRIINKFIKENKNFYLSVKKGMTFHYDDNDEINATINEALIKVTDAWLSTNQVVPLKVYAYPRVRRALKSLCHYNGLMGLTTSLAEYMTAANKLESNGVEKSDNSKINCCLKYRAYKRADVNTSFLAASKYHNMFRDETSIEKRLNSEWLLKLLKDKISDEAYHILYEHAVNGVSFSKIAKDVNKSNVSVWNTYNKTIKKLKNELNEEVINEWLN